jgi:hypothetical protein
MRIRVRWNKGELEGTLDDTPTARALYESLPFTSRANTWGEEVYFDAPVAAKLEHNARQVVDPGAICYWVQGQSLRPHPRLRGERMPPRHRRQRPRPFRRRPPQTRHRRTRRPDHRGNRRLNPTTHPRRQANPAGKQNRRASETGGTVSVFRTSSIPCIEAARSMHATGCNHPRRPENG